jgi:hypothetical protein
MTTNERAKRLITGIEHGLIGAALLAAVLFVHGETFKDEVAAENERKGQVLYIYVHDMAANQGRPQCPKINSGQILKASEREGATDGTEVLHCKYLPRSRVNDRRF